MYPVRLDILQVPRQDILMKADLCTATGRSYSQEQRRMEKSTRNMLPFMNR
jgi:hypothetical protein